MKDRHLKVTGYGCLKLAPDTIQVNIDLVEKNIDYGKALKLSNEKLVSLISVLKPLGFFREDVKTTYFNIESEYENIRLENGQYTNYFLGYKVSNYLKIEFPLNNDRLGNILESIDQCDLNPNISIYYKIKDKKNLEKKLLEKAVADCIEKSELLSKAAAIRLGDIVEIDSSSSKLNLYSNKIQYNRLNDSLARSYGFVDIEPDNIDNIQEISMTWEID